MVLVRRREDRITQQLTESADLGAGAKHKQFVPRVE
jgi:hypothetical protein